MIPTTASDIDAQLAEVERQNAELESYLEPLDGPAVIWRPDPTRWSVAGHVEHLNIVNAAYLGAIEETIAAARRSGGPESDGPYRHPFIARRFARMMEPPPSMRVKTARRMVPDPAVDAAASFEKFAEHQRRLASLLESSRGLDLGKIRFGSPFLALLRLSLGTGFEVLLHIWLIRELMSNDAFPGMLPESE